MIRVKVKVVKPPKSAIPAIPAKGAKGAKPAKPAKGANGAKGAQVITRAANRANRQRIAPPAGVSFYSLADRSTRRSVILFASGSLHPQECDSIR